MLKSQKLKILIVGNDRGVYRSQALVKFLNESEYHISFAKPTFHAFDFSNKKLNIRRKIKISLYTIKLFLRAAFTDAIYILPLNTDFIISALWAKLLLRKPLIVDLYISLYDTYVEDTKMFSSTSREAQTTLKKDVIAITKSDYLITPFHHQLDYWERKFSVTANKKNTFISPIFSNTELTHQRKFMQDGTLKICWWGTFIPLHGLDNILEALKILKERDVNFICNLFGVEYKTFYTYLEKIKASKLDSHVTLRKDLKFSDDSLPQYLVDNCDLALGIFGDVDKGKNAVSSKVIDALSMVITTITMKSPALKEFFDLNIDLWTCETAPKAIASAIESIVNGSAPKINWEQTRQKVLKTFNVTQYQNTINQILDKVVKEQNI